ncbi:MAG: 23S rRNA (adenine(2503)-C(2))-methyltransferase RlmN, partial [Armatimonadota bacterium]|nr:23S rRNA (adenine(2503)-C(2))-methyltransferase RlmN [Fimbriimonadaceae bacterium]
MPDGPRYLVGMTSSELKELAVGMGEKPFRGAQLADWIYRKAVLNFEEMTNLPAAFIAQLQEAGITPTPLRVVDHRRSTDDVDKLLMDAGDGNVFESVLLPYEDRVSCCLSSQVGCPMGCTFCATGLGGFTRNLTAGEIVGQYLALQSLSPRRVSHVV